MLIKKTTYVYKLHIIRICMYFENIVYNVKLLFISNVYMNELFFLSLLENVYKTILIYLHLSIYS